MNDRPICLFLPSLDAGGAERVMLLLAGHLAARGRRCDLVTVRAGGQWLDRIPDGVRHVSLSRAKPLHAIVSLVRYLRADRPAVVMSSVLPANLVALLACAIARVPCVLREANRVEADSRATRHHATWRNQWLVRRLYPKATAVVALTDALADHLSSFARVPSSRIAVIPNPAPALPARSRAPHRPPLILACGRLVEQKDFAMLLHAVSLLRDAPWKLVILGEGPLKQQLMMHARTLDISDRVSFAGYADDVGTWMAHASVFALSSQFEGFPNVLLEALSAGCPVVATQCSDAVDMLLSHGRHGAVVPVGDSTAMSGALRGVLDGSLRFAPARLDAYGLEAIGDRYIDVLDRAIRSGAN